jgi:hypothetical protein
VTIVPSSSTTSHDAPQSISCAGAGNETVSTRPVAPSISSRTTVSENRRSARPSTAAAPKPVAFDPINRLAERAPVTPTGWNVSSTVHVDAGGSITPAHVLVPRAKLGAFDPVTSTVRAPVVNPPAFVMVNVLALEVSPTSTVSKSWLGGSIVMSPAATTTTLSEIATSPPGLPETRSIVERLPSTVAENRTITSQPPSGSSTAPAHELASIDQPAPVTAAESVPDAVLPSFVT